MNNLEFLKCLQLCVRGTGTGFLNSRRQRNLVSFWRVGSRNGSDPTGRCPAAASPSVAPKNICASLRENCHGRSWLLFRTVRIEAT